MLLYDDSRHEYSDGWNIIPSVTQLLSSYFKIDPSYYAPGAAQRGTKAHELCAAHASGEVVVTANPYAWAFRQWMLDTRAEVIEVEKMIEGNVDGRRYAGRYDLLVKHRGRCLVDLKTGAKAPYFHAQLGGYALVERPARAMILYLRADGSYKEDNLTPGELSKGIQVFKAALAAWEGK
jgi:hypothetical protein